MSTSTTPSTGLDNVEVTELVEYILGSQTQPPEALERMMTNMHHKMQMALGYAIMANTQRQTKLQKFVSKLEDEIFDISDEQLMSMTQEEKENLYKSATKSLDSMNEFSRRFLAQNKALLNQSQTEQEKIAQQLMTLPESKVTQIMNIINGEKQDSDEEKSLEEEMEDLGAEMDSEEI